MEVGGIIILSMVMLAVVVTNKVQILSVVRHMTAYSHEAHLRPFDGDDRFSEMKFNCAYL
jgi:hypothetical protein